MKKIFILCAACVCAIQVSNAQTQKGTQTLGGSLSYSHLNTDQQSLNTASMLETSNYKGTSFSIGPGYSYFIADNLELGGILSYGSTAIHSSSGVTSSTDQSGYTFGGSVSLQKYFMYENKVGIRTGPYVSYFSGNNKYASSAAIYNTTGKNNAFSAGANLDLVYYPSKKIGVSATVASLAYSHSKQTTPLTPQNSSTSETFGLNFMNTGLTLGVFYVFGSK